MRTRRVFGAQILVLFVLLLAAFGLAPARAVDIAPGNALCHAVLPADTPAIQLAAAPLDCSTDEPRGYQRAILVVGIDVHSFRLDSADLVLLVHHTRFAKLTVLFRYADGLVIRQSVAQGAYEAYWRNGGQLLFVAPRRPGRLAEVRVAVDRLASVGLLRVRAMTRGAANRDLAIAAALTTFSLTLLLIGGIYNAALAVAVRREYLAWHAMWALCLLIWGLLWSQLALIVAPGLAGTESSQLCTLFSCLAVTAASFTAIGALGRHVRRWQRWLIFALALAVPVIGVPTSLMSGFWFDLLDNLLSLVGLVLLGLVTVCLRQAWREGSKDAHDLTLAWALPMLMFGSTLVIDYGAHVFGGGAQIVVLLACALQTVWLSLAATRRLSRLRIELEAARAAETALAELARRDPLTSMLNRRGFIEQVNRRFARDRETDFGLLLIDVDHFKSINDRFGHEAGDVVLCCIAERLMRFESADCMVGRLGGEEFVLGVGGLGAVALSALAEEVRIALAECDHGAISRQRRVTVSIGVAQGSTATPFQKMYGSADRALYEAKHAGRDVVIFHGNPAEQALLARDQHSFGW